MLIISTLKLATFLVFSALMVINGPSSLLPSLLTFLNFSEKSKYKIPFLKSLEFSFVKREIKQQ